MSVQESWQALRELLKFDRQDEENAGNIRKIFMAHSRDEDPGILEKKSRVYQSLLEHEVRNWRLVILKERNL